MKDPNRNTSDYCRRQARERSYENMRLKIARDILALINDYKMTPQYLADSLGMELDEFKELLWDTDMRLSDLNRIMDIFSHELVPIFRKRWPDTHS